MINSAGMLYLYLSGKMLEDDKMVIAHVDSYECYKQNFLRKIQELRNDYQEDSDVEIFSIVGEAAKIDALKIKFVETMRKSFYEIISGNQLSKEDYEFDDYGERFLQLLLSEILSEHEVKYPRLSEIQNNEWKMVNFWFEDSPEEKDFNNVDGAVNLWLNIERPFLMGKQLMINSFLYRDLNHRKIICAKPDEETGEWYLLIEGGMKIFLNAEVPYNRERFKLQTMGQFGITDVENVINNPAYALGKHYEPFDLFLDWQKVYLFQIAIRDNINVQKVVQKTYKYFLKFMEDNICNTLVMSPIIDENMFYHALCVHVENIRKILQGEEEEILSKDFLLLMDSRNVYMDYICALIDDCIGEYLSENQNFNKSKFEQKLENCRTADTAYLKGVFWEEMVSDYIESIVGLKVMARRKRTQNEEIDLSVVNVSKDERL